MPVIVQGVAVFVGVIFGVFAPASVVFGVVMSCVGFGVSALLRSQWFAGCVFFHGFVGNFHLVCEMDFFGFFFRSLGRLFRGFFLFFGFLVVENRSTDERINLGLGLCFFLFGFDKT